MAELQTVIAKTSGLQLKTSTGSGCVPGGGMDWLVGLSENPLLPSFVFAVDIWSTAEIDTQPFQPLFPERLTSGSVHSQVLPWRTTFSKRWEMTNNSVLLRSPQGLGTNLASKKRVKFSGKTWSLGGSESCLQWHVKLLRGRGVLGTLGLHSDGLRFLYCFYDLYPWVLCTFAFKGSHWKSSFRGLFLDYWAALLIDQTDRSTELEVSWVALWSVTKIHGGVWKSSFLTLSRDKVRRWDLHSKEPPHRSKAALSRALLVIVPPPFFVFPFCPPARSLTGSPGSTSM